MTINGLDKSSPNFDFSMVDPKNHTPKQVKAYVSQYFVPLVDGNHAVFINGKYTIMDQTAITKTYFNRMASQKSDDDDDRVFNISKWYFTGYKNLCTITYELNKDILSEGKLNLCPQMKHSYQPFKDFDEKTQKRVNVMLNYIQEVLASGHKDQFEYILKWFAYMVKGFKNTSILYLRGGQGIGKSTLFEFVRDYVVGTDLSLESGSEPIVSRFIAILGGKSFVYFEELETFNVSQWMAVSSRLKRFATSNTIILEDKNMKAYTSNNMNNYAVLSNNDAIKDDEGRRYFILDISTHRKVIKGSKSEQDNMKFWTNVHKCFNDQVGHAFFCYLMEINTDKFNSQDFPMTQSKLDSFAKRLESHEVFLKNNYVLRKGDIKCIAGELHEEYESYCKANGSKSISKIEFNKKLKELGIEPYKSNSTNKFKVSSERLQEIAAERHWIHSTDDYFEDEEKKDGVSFLPDPHGLDYGLSCEELKDDELLRKYNNSEKELNDLKDQFEKMRLEFEQYKLNYPKEVITQEKEMELQQEKICIELCENGEVDFIDFDTLIEQAPTIERSHKKKTK